MNDQPIPTFIFDSLTESIHVDSIRDICDGSVTSSVLASLLDFAPIQILLKDPDGHYLYLNRLARQLLRPNSDADSPIGTRDTEASVVPAQVARWREEEERCIRTGILTESEVTWTNVSHDTRTNTVLNVPVKNRSGNTIGVGVIAYDITHKAQIKMSTTILELLQHDWVHNLLMHLINRIDTDSKGGVSKEVLSGITLAQLKIVFEFMRSYLVQLPSLLTGYLYSGSKRSSQQVDLADMVSYMRQLSQMIGLKVDLHLTASEPRPMIYADEECMRIMVYEIMKNHSKYGEGDLVQVTTSTACDGNHLIINFISPGMQLTRTNAYELLFNQGVRIETIDSKGRPKQPPGRGLGLYYCRTFALAQNHLAEVDHEYRNIVYGAKYDATLSANVFFFRFRGEPQC